MALRSEKIVLAVAHALSIRTGAHICVMQDTQHTEWSDGVRGFAVFGAWRGTLRELVDAAHKHLTPPAPKQREKQDDEDETIRKASKAPASSDTPRGPPKVRRKGACNRPW